MPKLMLGVIDVIYDDPDTKKVTTTGEVAGHLENKYHPMRVFIEEHWDDISELVVSAFETEVESIAQGAEPVLEINVGKVDQMFRDFLSHEEWEGVSGQRIAAAEEGSSKRFKNKKETGDNVKKERTSRPAFVDTGLYQANMRTWVDK